MVTLKARIDGRDQSVATILSEANYRVAVHAHEAREPVIARGDLARVGQRWHLSNARLSIFSLDDIKGDDDVEQDSGAAEP